MAKKEKEPEDREKMVKKAKKEKKHEKKKKRKSVTTEDEPSANEAFSLLADEKTVDPVLSSLFAAKPTPPVRVVQTQRSNGPTTLFDAEDDASEREEAEPSQELSELDDVDLISSHPVASDERARKRERKRKHDDDDIEDVYMRRLAREEARDIHTSKRQKPSEEYTASNGNDETTPEDAEAESEPEPGNTELELESDGELSPPPRHETEQALDNEIDKANRTVFLGNISTAAISSKASRKTLLDHLKSIFPTEASSRSGKPKHSLESIRFRSTPYATPLPKKAAFAKREVMDATTKSTNAYAIYSSPVLVREAVNQLNGSIVLDRHLRVDSVAHPMPVDHRRCVFVGNLGFVDDESNIQAANEEEGKETRKRAKQPADNEEGLWRTFGKCGKVESVRVIRDSATRVGKGIAYVQFEDGIAVEAALGLDGKKFPPMLPRKLRVSRAKAVKRTSDKPRAEGRVERSSKNGYRRQVSEQDASQTGTLGKLYGKAAAAQMKQRPAKRHGDSKPASNGGGIANGIQKPEAFVFEGHRATNKGGKAGLKFGKKKAGKPTNRSARRGAAFKASGKKRAQT